MLTNPTPGREMEEQKTQRGKAYLTAGDSVRKREKEQRNGEEKPTVKFRTYGYKGPMARSERARAGAKRRGGDRFALAKKAAGKKETGRLRLVGSPG